jgi:hypothetical protein
VEVWDSIWVLKQDLFHFVIIFYSGSIYISLYIFVSLSLSLFLSLSLSIYIYIYIYIYLFLSLSLSLSVLKLSKKINLWLFGAILLQKITA